MPPDLASDLPHCRCPFDVSCDRIQVAIIGLVLLHNNTTFSHVSTLVALQQLLGCECTILVLLHTARNYINKPYTGIVLLF